jgi:ABC-type sulfate transport system substrate-binding protein
MSLLDLFDATPPTEIQLQLAAPAAVVDALGADALPRFAARWGAENHAVLSIQPLVGDAVSITRHVAEKQGVDVVILPALPAWLVLADAGHVDPESLLFVASDTLAIGVRAGNPSAITDWASLERTGARLALPGAGAHTRAHLLLGGLWQSVGIEEPEHPGAGTTALVRALRTASSKEGSADDAIERFVAGEGDAVLGEARVLREAGVEVVVPPMTLRSPLVAGVATPTEPGTAEHRAAQALVRVLAGSVAQVALARAGFDEAPEAADDTDAWADMARAVRRAGVAGPAASLPLEVRSTVVPAPASPLEGFFGALIALTGGLGLLFRQLLHPH